MLNHAEGSCGWTEGRKETKRRRSFQALGNVWMKGGGGELECLSRGNFCSYGFEILHFFMIYSNFS